MLGTSSLAGAEMAIRLATPEEHAALLPFCSDLRPVSSPREVGAASLAAPVPTGQGPGTHQRCKHWQQLALILDQLALEKPSA